MSDETAVVTEAIVRVPDNPVELLALKEELEGDLVKIGGRIDRAVEQKNKAEQRLAKVNFRLDDFQKNGGGDMAKAAASFIASEEERIVKEQARMAALRARFGL